MPIDLKVPNVGESITEVEIGDWLKAEGEPVSKDENIVVIESEKATVEIPAPESGTLSKILKKKGRTAKVGEVIGSITPGKAPAKAAERKTEPARREAREPRSTTAAKARVMPAAARALAEHRLKAGDVEASGPGGRLLKEDVLRHVQGRAAPPPEKKPAPSPAPPSSGDGDRQEEIVPMTALRRTIAQRLVEAQQSMAMLTTFNEIDMSHVMALRKQHQEAFQNKHGVKLGFMSFFIKACIEALKLYPQLNAEVRNSEVVYHNYYDIGVAIGSGRGLVVPVLRNAERMSFAGLEGAIAGFAQRAQENKLKIEELKGGTFTISNGGVYGSLLSTPIVNPPQSGILGMHTIQERPVAIEGSVVIRPMMYVALSYDHRIVDGREAVIFLRRIKELIENPARMLLET